MAPKDLLIACVGKPSAGKSSFLNAATNANAKVGNYPFTTIEPNQGIAYYTTDCACKKYSVTANCRPRYGKCVDGIRWIPIKILDVAGLVPGASTGQGLGNQFLDDLRHADVLLHVVDVSGTTDSHGKETAGYDPINDIDWLRMEIFEWVYANLKKSWGAVVRKAVSSKMSLDKTILRPFSGYGANPRICARVVAAMDNSLIMKSVDQWNDDDLVTLVNTFLSVRFPTVIALNKIDLPDSDKNIAKIFNKYKNDVKQNNVVLISALAENFLRKMQSAGYIHYVTGTDQVYTSEDPVSDYPDQFKHAKPLLPLDEKAKKRLDKVLDMIVFRYGSTGCQDAIRTAVHAANLTPFYPVRSQTFAPCTFYFLSQSAMAASSTPSQSAASSTTGSSQSVFVDCFLVNKNYTVREVVEQFYSENELSRGNVQSEAVGGRQISDDDKISTVPNQILCFKYRNTSHE